jgi:hypothetical protein
MISRLKSKYLQQIADPLNPIADLASQGHLVANSSRLKREFDEASETDRKALLVKLLDAELAKIGDSNVHEVLMTSLKGSGTAAGTATAGTSLTATGGVTKVEQVRAAEQQAACPGVSLPYLRKLRTTLKKEGVLQSQGYGRSARWVRTGKSG